MARFTRSNTPLLEPTLAFAAGILAFALPDRADHIVLPFLVFGIVLAVLLPVKLWFAPRIASWGRMAAWGLFFWAGTALAALHRVDPEPTLRHHGERLTFIGRIESVPEARGRWYRSDATLFCYADSTTQAWQPLESRIRLYIDTTSRNPRPRIGDVLRFRGRIYASDSSGYDLYMRRTRGFTARCFAWTAVRIGTDTTLTTRIEQLRHQWGTRLLARDTLYRDDAGPILQALAVGDQSDITPELRDSYSRTGVVHLLSVSGLHVGIVFLILNLMFGWIRLFRHGTVALGIVVILCLVCYAALTGLSPSVIRAVTMFSLLQIGLMLSRYTNSLNTLCAAALLLLIWNPYNLYHIGFQLSFAAMVGIITLYQPIARLWMPRHVLLRWLWSLSLVGITAQIGTFPLVMYHFGQLQLAGLLLNPLIWFTVPVIIGGSLLYLAGGWEWVLALTRTVAEWQNSAITWMAGHSWVAVTDIRLEAWLCAAMYLVILILIVWVNRRSSLKTRSYLLRSVDADDLRAAK